MALIITYENTRWSSGKVNFHLDWFIFYVKKKSHSCFNILSPLHFTCRIFFTSYSCVAFFFFLSCEWMLVWNTVLIWCVVRTRMKTQWKVWGSVLLSLWGCDCQLAPVSNCRHCYCCLCQRQVVLHGGIYATSGPTTQWVQQHISVWFTLSL